MKGRTRVLSLLDGRPLDRLPLMPITMMFAADQIGVPYGRYATDHRVLVRGQIETARRFDFDHVSAISDPCREAADLGAAIEYYPDQPPAVVESKALLGEARQLARLECPDPTSAPRMADRIAALSLLRQEVGGDLLIEGWVEGPCALAANLRGINALMLDVVDEPGFVRDLCAFCVELALLFARAQVEAGADLIGIGDAAASLVGPARYEELVFPEEQRLIEGIHALGARTRLHICGRTRRLLRQLARLGTDILDLDWMVPIEEARAACGPEQVLLGNIDPVALLRGGTPAGVREGLGDCHAAAGGRYIVGAGCEVVRDTPLPNLLAMVEYARAHGGRAGPGSHP
ncbi:MAG: uroporphyrinogen decarboxylase [Deltaproteobacteria bacterium]|jgi:MtaA/CmuA family methyltransferase|nr:uroporphyrinogen decarboxylase [Deltaproteobacteria bacterium]